MLGFEMNERVRSECSDNYIADEFAAIVETTRLPALQARIIVPRGTSSGVATRGATGLEGTAS